VGARLAAFALILLLVSCAPVQTYDELSEEARVTGDNTKVEKFEANVHKAEIYYQNRAQCNASHETMWYCDGFRERKPRSTWSLEQMVRGYKLDHSQCSCVNTERQLREIRRAMGNY